MATTASKVATRKLVSKSAILYSLVWLIDLKILLVSEHTLFVSFKKFRRSIFFEDNGFSTKITSYWLVINCHYLLRCFTS